MSRIIWKYPLEFNEHGHCSVLMPQYHQVLHLGEQAGIPTIWAAVDPDRAETHVHFTVLGTGMDVPPGARHIGTVVLARLVWHVFGEAHGEVAE